MRRLDVIALGLVVVMTLSGCAAFRNRQWGTCAVAGGILGAAAAGVAGGVVTNNEHDASDLERGGAIAGGIVGGATLGALLGHLICDPVKEYEVAQAPPPPAPDTNLATLRGPNFEFNRAEINPSGEVILEEAVRVMQQHQQIQVNCDGYTDSIGSDSYNLGLSERRAESVRDFLVSRGIDGSRIYTRGFGESNPIASNDTEDGRAQNRRVEIIVR